MSEFNPALIFIKPYFYFLGANSKATPMSQLKRFIELVLGKFAQAQKYCGED